MTTVFHKTSISKEKLKDIIAKNPQSLMDGLAFIDFQLAADEQGIIDSLGVDREGRLVLVNFEVGLNDGMFIASLGQIHWLKKNNGLIKRLFFSENIEFSLDPYILLVSGSFSERLKSAVKQTKLQGIRLVEFKYITAEGKDAIIFEEVFPSKNVLVAETSPNGKENISVREKDTPPAKGVPQESLVKPDEDQVEIPDLILKDVSLSQEEIAEFMEFEKTLEEKNIAA